MLPPTTGFTGQACDVLLFRYAIQDAFQAESCLLNGSQEGLCMLPELCLIRFCFLVHNSTCAASFVSHNMGRPQLVLLPIYCSNQQTLHKLLQARGLVQYCLSL